MSQPGNYWPVYTGKSFNIWEADTGSYSASVEPSVARDALQRKRENGHRNSKSAFSRMPDEWVANPNTLPCLAPRIAIRDTTNSTNTRTIICALVPKNIVITHQAPYLLRISGTAQDEALLLGVLSSMILDWYARRVVELHLTASHLNSFPMPRAGPQDPIGGRLVEIAGRLAAVDERFAEWADEVGVPVGSANDETTKQDLIHELDACVAHLYGLDKDDLEVIYTTFDEKRPDRYTDRHAAVLVHFRRWRDGR